MRITIPQVLTVSETFTLARFGELLLSSDGRLAQPTNVVAPGAPAIARQALNDRNRILLDDGDNRQNIDPNAVSRRRVEREPHGPRRRHAERRDGRAGAAIR
jgi:predicted extracellular nuclease